MRGNYPAFYASNLLIDPIFISGWCFTVAGSLIRLSCYRELGHLYTFQPSILKNHKLVTTGPYSVVRHPSYTGTILAVMGITLCHLSRGSWLTECSGILNRDLGRSLALVWLAGELAAVWVSVARIGKEDRMLKKNFGKKWDKWAEDVPSKLIPGVY